MEIISTEKAPKPVGSYSQAVVAGGFMYISGQIPLNIDGSLVSGDIKEEAKTALANVKAILAAKGLDFSNVVKIELYLDDIKNFNDVDTIYSEILGNNRPARQAMEVAKLPKGAGIEISCIAKVD